MRTFAPMNFTSQMRHNPDTGEDEKYYRLKESYRDAMGRSCSRTLLNVGFIHGLKPEEIRDITYNLDIRQFVYDLLLNAVDHRFVAHFYHAMQHVTILDPTCGSGAFLFAAMNILEPLYEVCIERMEQWHEENPNLFRDELDEINRKKTPNGLPQKYGIKNLKNTELLAEIKIK